MGSWSRDEVVVLLEDARQEVRGDLDGRLADLPVELLGLLDDENRQIRLAALQHDRRGGAGDRAAHDRRRRNSARHGARPHGFHRSEFTADARLNFGAAASSTTIVRSTASTGPSSWTKPGGPAHRQTLQAGRRAEPQVDDGAAGREVAAGVGVFVTIVRPPGSFAVMRAPIPSRLSLPGDPQPQAQKVLVRRVAGPEEERLGRPHRADVRVERAVAVGVERDGGAAVGLEVEAVEERALLEERRRPRRRRRGCGSSGRARSRRSPRPCGRRSSCPRRSRPSTRASATRTRARRRGRGRRPTCRWSRRCRASRRRRGRRRWSSSSSRRSARPSAPSRSRKCGRAAGAAARCPRPSPRTSAPRSRGTGGRQKPTGIAGYSWRKYHCVSVPVGVDVGPAVAVEVRPRARHPVCPHLRAGLLRDVHERAGRLRCGRGSSGRSRWSPGGPRGRPGRSPGRGDESVQRVIPVEAPRPSSRR